MRALVAFVLVVALSGDARAVSFPDAHLVEALTRCESAGCVGKARASAVSDDGEDLGLGQVRARHVGACRSDPSPVLAPGPACLAVRARLLEPAYNLKITKQNLRNGRKTCLKRTGRATVRDVIMFYGGLNKPKRGIWCGRRKDKRGKWVDLPTPKSVQRILKLYRQLREGRSTGRRSARKSSTTS